MQEADSTQIRNAEREQGFVFVFLSIAIVTLLMMMGLAADSARLYLDSMRKQRAADAGTVAGTFKIAQLRNVPEVTKKAIIEDIAKQVSEDNFSLNRVPFNPEERALHFSSSFNPNDNGVMSVTSTVRSQTETIIIGKWVGGRDNWMIEEKAKGIRRPVAVTLLLDVSGSMDWPARANCSECGTKMEALKVAAKGFVAGLDPAIDRVSITTYSDHSTILYPEVPQDRNGINTDKVNSIINSLQPQGWTNVHHGLWNASIEANHESLPAGALRVIILVTDGAPNRSLRSTENPEYDPVTRYGYEDGSCNDLEQGLQDTKNERTRDDYLQAIMEADRIRSQGVLIFTVGVGVADTDQSTAYQNLGNDKLLKRPFLNRVSNHADRGAEDPHEFPCVPNYEKISEAPAGQNLESDDANDLPQMLFSILRKIQARLVE